MSVCRKLPDGTVQKIAGHTILLDANASEVRTGNFNITGGPAGWVEQTITFSDPMPDTDYVVVLECNTQNWGGGENSPGPFRIHSKHTTGFVLGQYNTTGAAGFSFIGTYTAFKPVKIEGYTALQNKVNNPDNTPTIDSMNLVTSDGVARAIENASAVWKGTKAEWNALPATTKIKYDLAVLIDTQLIKSVDRTDGTDSDVADLTSVWTGTQAEWDAMTQAQKDKWDKAMIQDGYYGITPAILPVGCVQAYMGSVEPPGWMICNGQIFDPSVYPDLYSVLGINKVPDLQGQFLRGAGTNSDSTQGNGGTVGQRQKATLINEWTYGYNKIQMPQNASEYHGNINNPDSITQGETGVTTQFTGTGSGTVRLKNKTVRPTNTSVNWIIFAGPAQ